MTRARRSLAFTITLSAQLFAVSCTQKSSSSGSQPAPADATATPPTAATVPAVVPPAPAVPGAVPPPATTVTTATTATTGTTTATATATATPYATIKCLQYTGASVSTSPLPEMDANWKLESVSCVSGPVLPLGTTLNSNLQLKKQEVRLTIGGSKGAMTSKKIPDPAAPQNHCAAKSNFLMSFLPSEVEMRFDKAPWSAAGSATCPGEVAAESWIATVCVTGTANNVLVIVRNERNAADRYCTDGNSKLVYTKE